MLIARPDNNADYWVYICLSEYGFLRNLKYYIYIYASSIYPCSTHTYRDQILVTTSQLMILIDSLEKSPLWANNPFRDNNKYLKPPHQPTNVILRRYSQRQSRILISNCSLFNDSISSTCLLGSLPAK